MKPLLLTLLLATLCATGYGQTIKTLGYNTTNGNVVYTGTNVLTFTNNIGFSSGRIEIGQGLGFWDAADGSYALFFQGDDPVILNSRWNDSGVRSALGLGATWLTNTDVTNFRTAIGLGATNDVEFLGVQSSDAVINDLQVNSSAIFGAPIEFGGTNPVANAAITRTNLGLPLPALTNTNNADTMRALAGSTNTNEPFSGVVNVSDPEASVTWALTFSNGILIRREEI
jgi:hypothetical protein